MGRPKKYENTAQLGLRVPTWVIELIDDERERIQELALKETGFRVSVSRTDVVVGWAEEAKKRAEDGVGEHSVVKVSANVELAK